MKIIILAGGKATRLLNSAKNIPKLLIKVGDKTILEHQIDLLKEHGLSDIRLSLGYRAEQIIEYLKQQGFRCYPLAFLASPSEARSGIRPRSSDPSRRPCPLGLITRSKITSKTLTNIEYIIEPEPLGTGGAIKFASRDLDEDFMVLNGDVLSNIDFSEFIKFHKKSPQANSLTTWYCQDCCDYGMIELENQKIVKFLEKPKKICAGYINAGFYILSPEIFKIVSRETFSIEHDIFPNLAKNNQLAAYIYKGYWTDLGTEKRLKEARKRFNG